MNIKHILCPIDFSKPSEAAIDHASAIARRYDAKLHFVYVYEPVFADGYINGMPMQVPPADIEPMRERLEQIRPVGEGNLDFCHELIFGFPAAALVGYAATKEIDLIVMGTHGRTGASRLLMGSVAEAITRAASCPVMTVHQANSPVAIG